ncbi:Golgi SNAP receptor complex member 1 [Orchesella cincta]|uniref:Golgi SNAP receptor complex member 1 n=1 Tax=Orchesella cincta TaxID=48709 RepID=A0A1D2N930_ORCCI|nr:Golgi SNAP receptor complex member 1 [Orchesella cincta]
MSTEQTEEAHSTMGDAKKHWEDLRREARFLENEIDTKLVSYSKIGANSTLSAAADRESDTAPLLSSGRMYESLSEEIDVLLKRLTEVNEKMGEFPPQNSSLATPALIHTLTRHRDILQDYTQEFRKTQNNLKSRKEREELLQGVKKEIDSSKTALNRRLDLYMKERDHLVSSERMVDEQIAIAIDTKEGLVTQRAAFKKIQSRMMDITSRFPTLNNLIHKINMKKRKDSIIIGCVIGICTFLLLYYGFHN